MVNAFIPKNVFSTRRIPRRVPVPMQQTFTPSTTAFRSQDMLIRIIANVNQFPQCRMSSSTSNDASLDMKKGLDGDISGDWCEPGTSDDDVHDDGNDGSEDNEIPTEEEEEETKDEHSELYDSIRSSVEKAIDTQTKKRKALQNELDKAKSLEDTMKRANLIISNLYQLPAGVKSATVQDWDRDGEDVTLELDDEYGSAQEEADALFASARKMKRGSAVVSTLIAETNEALRLLDDAILDLDFALSEADGSGNGLDEGRLHLISDRLERTSKQTGFVAQKLAVSDADRNNRPKKKSKPWKQSKRQENTFRKFLSPGGCIVLVGRNRRDNEAICFQVARGDDIWMHSRGCPGAHVLLQVRRGSPRPTEECMQFAADLAAFYSDARTERKAPITTASPKHIQKPRGAPLGAVKLRQELNTLTGYPADVDDELKIAREKSGVIWDESGSRSLGGKAKNRKKTQANAKQLSAKKRAQKKADKKNNRRSDSSEGETSWY
jgi:predicted ribosome quality control (RQC) complex YloA/Tae2 family protein